MALNDGMSLKTMNFKECHSGEGHGLFINDSLKPHLVFQLVTSIPIAYPSLEIRHKHQKAPISLKRNGSDVPDCHFCYIGNFLHTMIYNLTGISFV